MRKRISFVFLILVGIFTCFTLAVPAQAAISGAAGFSVEPVNDSDAEKTDFYSLNLQPGQSSALRLKVTNNLNRKIKVVVIPTVAVTTNGQINYNAVTNKRDSSLKYDWTKMGPTKQNITLLPKQSQVVTENITLPQDKFNGVMLGSLYVYSPTVNNKLKKDA
ncbi:DUF916 domain-containing protein, partial [Lactobacillus sp. XV13L]|nr:DUF916 domain-containing protein [Lactobacillus sp. XV13L]